MRNPFRLPRHNELALDDVSNAELSRRELSLILGSPAAQAAVEFGLEFAGVQQEARENPTQ